MTNSCYVPSAAEMRDTRHSGPFDSPASRLLSGMPEAIPAVLTTGRMQVE